MNYLLSFIAGAVVGGTVNFLFVRFQVKEMKAETKKARAFSELLRTEQRLLEEEWATEIDVRCDCTGYTHKVSCEYNHTGEMETT